VDGTVWHSVPTAEVVGLAPTRIAGMRAAIAARPRIEVAAG
jgi:hypothetical protein